MIFQDLTLFVPLVMFLVVITGMSPRPNPIPLALVSQVFGATAPKPLLMVLAIFAHLAYGGFWGTVLAVSIRPVTVWKGIGLGVFLWLVMQLVFLPFLGWGIFGSAITPRIAVVTLVLHVIYGTTLGFLMAHWEAVRKEDVCATVPCPPSSHPA